MLREGGAAVSCQELTQIGIDEGGGRDAVSCHELLEIGRDAGRGGNVLSCHELPDNGLHMGLGSGCRVMPLAANSFCSSYRPCCVLPFLSHPLAASKGYNIPSL
jgi:hypothetical protein